MAAVLGGPRGSVGSATRSRWWCRGDPAPGRGEGQEGDEPLPGPLPRRRRLGVLAGPGRTGGRRLGPVGRPPRRGRCRLGRRAAATPLPSPWATNRMEARIRWTTQVGTMESGQVASTASGGPAGPSQHTISTSCTPLLARSAHTWRPSRRPPPRPGSRSPARARAPSMPRAHGDAGSGVPGTRWSARTIGADRVEADHRVEGHPEAGAATFMTAPAHRVGDLGGSSPCSGPAPMVDPRVVADLARGHPPGVQADDHRVQPAPSSSGPCAPGAASSEPARTPGGAPSLEGAHLASRWSWSWSRPRALAAGRCRRLSPLHGPGARPARPAGRAPEPPRGRAGSSPRAPVISTSPESICSNRPHPGPGLAQPPGHIAPVDGLVPLLSRSHRRQSFHQGLHRPLNTPPVPPLGRTP